MKVRVCGVVGGKGDRRPGRGDLVFAGCDPVRTASDAGLHGADAAPQQRERSAEPALALLPDRAGVGEGWGRIGGWRDAKSASEGLSLTWLGCVWNCSICFFLFVREGE
jgi:hypothetical protein